MTAWLLFSSLTISAVTATNTAGVNWWIQCDEQCSDWSAQKLIKTNKNRKSMKHFCSLASSLCKLLPCLAVQDISISVEQHPQWSIYTLKWPFHDPLTLPSNTLCGSLIQEPPSSKLLVVYFTSVDHGARLDTKSQSELQTGAGLREERERRRKSSWRGDIRSRTWDGNFFLWHNLWPKHYITMMAQLVT